MTARIIRVLRHAGRAIILTVATLYFLIDLIFFSVLRPLRRRLMALRWVRVVREWVGTLNPYSALLLLLVPWLILEPIKPIGFLLLAHQRHLAATLLIVVGEVVKLTLFEQLFDMTRPKLMSFRWFAWSYNKWRATIEYLRSLPVWHTMLCLCRTVRAWARRWRISQWSRVPKWRLFRRGLCGCCPTIIASQDNALRRLISAVAAARPRFPASAAPIVETPVGVHASRHPSAAPSRTEPPS